jgi:hypothetical protein
MTKRRQILLVLDVDKSVVADEVTELLPHQRDARELVKLTDLGAPRLGRMGSTSEPIDWQRIHQSVEIAAEIIRTC